MTSALNGGDAEPWNYAERRLRTCGRVISLAPDKLAALVDLADGLAGDVHRGFLNGQEVVDHLHHVADAYGLVAEHGGDTVQGIIADSMGGRAAPAQGWPAASHGTILTPVPVGQPLGQPVTTLDVSEFLARKFPPREMMFSPWLPTQGI